MDCTTALAILLDWLHYTPEQRNRAGELLGTQPGSDPRAGVGVRSDGLPDIDWVEVPEMDSQGHCEFIYQQNIKRVEPTYWIGRYPVTYSQFQAFVEAEDGYQSVRWWLGLDASADSQRTPEPQRFPFWNHPRENVTWHAAVAFCRWLACQAEGKRELLPAALRERKDWCIRLPTEWQWEKAARSHDGRRYPWGGDQYLSGYANIDETYQLGGIKPVGVHFLRKTSAVGMYPQGASPFGVCDLSGNVLEWCLTNCEPTDFTLESGREARVSRGGSWDFTSDFAASLSHSEHLPDYCFDFLGFRVAACLTLTTQF